MTVANEEMRKKPLLQVVRLFPALLLHGGNVFIVFVSELLQWQNESLEFLFYAAELCFLKLTFAYQLFLQLSSYRPVASHFVSMVLGLCHCFALLLYFRLGVCFGIVQLLQNGLPFFRLLKGENILVQLAYKSFVRLEIAVRSKIVEHHGHKVPFLKIFLAFIKFFNLARISSQIAQ